MDAQIVFALYRAHEGKDDELRALISQHIPTLRKLGLITDRESIESSALAHQNPESAKIWQEMGQIAEMPTLDSLEEAKSRFPHFEPVKL